METIGRYTTDGTPYQCPICVRIFFSPIAYGKHRCEDKRINENLKHYKAYDKFIKTKTGRWIKRR